MWPKPNRKKGKGTKSKLKAVKEDTGADSSSGSNAESGFDSESSGSSRSERRKTRPPNRNRRQRSSNSSGEDGNPGGSNSIDSDPENKEVSREQSVSGPRSESPSAAGASFERSPLTSSGDVWKDRILKAYRGNPRDSAQLLAIVPNQRAQFEAGERQKQELIEESMIRIVDRMFDNFQNTAYGFNRVTQGSDLELTWIRPSLTSEAQGNWVEGSAEGVRVFNGRISTRYWTLVVRGTARSILTFILPSDKLLSFGSSATDFDPYLEIFPQSDGMSVTWFIKDREITQDIFPSVFRALLDGLIRFANEEAEANEAFRLEDIGFVPEPKEAPVETPHLDEGEPELLGQELEPEPEPDPEPDPEPEPAPDPEPRPENRGHSVEKAIDLALGGQSDEEIVDPGAGFIQSVSSQVASQAARETDILRESMKGLVSHPAENESLETGQWKMVNSNLPPSVASQWQNYVKKTGDGLAESESSGQFRQSNTTASPAVRAEEEEKWNVVPDTDNYTAPQMPQFQMPPQGLPQGFSQNQGMPPGQPAGWVHPSQLPPQQAAQPPMQAPPPVQYQYTRPGQMDDEETLEFQAPSEHSQYLLTEQDIDDRAIQAPPPDPDMSPAVMLSRSMQVEQEQDQDQEQDQAHIQYQYGEEEIEYEDEEDDDEETVQYQVDEADLPGVLAAVMNTIDMKVETLSQKGAQAFSQKDFKRAELIIKLSERLNEFKDEAGELLGLLEQEE